MSELAGLIRGFGELLTPTAGNDIWLTKRIAAVGASGLPHLHAFVNGLELDRAAIDAGPTLPITTAAPRGRRRRR
jgi:hypothetical protein